MKYFLKDNFHELTKQKLCLFIIYVIYIYLKFYPMYIYFYPTYIYIAYLYVDRQMIDRFLCNPIDT